MNLRPFGWPWRKVIFVYAFVFFGSLISSNKAGFFGGMIVGGIFGICAVIIWNEWPGNKRKGLK